MTSPNPSPAPINPRNASNTILTPRNCLIAASLAIAAVLLIAYQHETNPVDKSQGTDAKALVPLMDTKDYLIKIKQEAQEVTIKKGDSLEKLIRQKLRPLGLNEITGNDAAREVLHITGVIFNPGVKDLDKLRVGQKIILPSDEEILRIGTCSRFPNGEKSGKYMARLREATKLCFEDSKK